jgi:hypothetical protein
MPYNPKQCLFRVVIRNLHYTTPISNIFESLAALSHTVTRVTNVLKLNVALLFFCLDSTIAEDNYDIFNISSLLNTLVIIENPYKVNRDPS